jgi:hypothetical protein
LTFFYCLKAHRFFSLARSSTQSRASNLRSDWIERQIRRRLPIGKRVGFGEGNRQF